MALTPGRAASSLGFLDGFVRGVGRGSGDDGDASGYDFDGGVDDVQPFVVGERGRLAGGAAGNKKIDSRFDLPRDQIAQGCVVDGAILMKGSYEGGATATELHRNRITRMRVEGKLRRSGLRAVASLRYRRTADGGVDTSRTVI